MARNARSHHLTQGPQRTPNRALFRATGFTDTDFDKPVVGIANGFNTTAPCNMGLNTLATRADWALREAGAMPQRFGTIAVSGGVSMGTPGARYALVSREVVADSIETVCDGQLMDGLLAIGAGDNDIPGALMAIARLNIPAVFVHGGTMKPGHLHGRDLSIVSAIEAVGAYGAQRIDLHTLLDIERHACPGAGGGMSAANTMAAAAEALGMSLARSSTGAAEDAETADNAGASARALMRAIDLNLRPRDLLTREAFENAIALVMAIGGSTDAVLHLLAIAHAAEVPLSIDDFEAIRRKVPVLCDLKPAGRYMTTDFHRAGGVPQVLRLLLDHGLLHGDSRTISGRTLAETLAIIPGEPDPQQAVIRPWRDPVHSEGSVAVFRGNLAPGGAVAWIAGITSRSLTGPARIFDSEQAALAAILDHRIHAGDVIVIRGQGPQGGPGMCALMIVTSILVATGLGHQVGLITDGRVSSDPHSLVVGHITPEAAVGGPIALLQESDSITIDIDHQRLDVQLSEADLASRQAQWHQPAETAKPGAVLTKYAKLVSSASEGAVTR